MVYQNIFSPCALLFTIKQPSGGLSLPGYHKRDEYLPQNLFKGCSIFDCLIQRCFEEVPRCSKDMGV